METPDEKKPRKRYEKRKLVHTIDIEELDSRKPWKALDKYKKEMKKLRELGFKTNPDKSSRITLVVHVEREK